MQLPCLYMGLDVSVLRICHLDTAQCRILKDSGRFHVKIPRGLGLMVGNQRVVFAIAVFIIEGILL